MTKRIQAKHKLDRRMGENIWGRPKSPVNIREYGPGQHGQRRRSKQSDYGLQLRAKQKLKGYYGNIQEKHFRSLYKKASKIKGDTGENLIGLLESRIDAIIYRAKFIPTVFAARQFINHGHVLLNGKKHNIPSTRLSPGDIVEIREKSREIPMVIEALNSSERDVPEYVSREGYKATYVRIPQFDEVPYPVIMEPHLVVEFYSR
ncbi:MAG: 30S ribosomal protein S4 [Sphingomonadales bacterium]